MTNFNLSQKTAIEYNEGPLLIVAGAGTGKTTVIANKIAFLIQKGLAQPAEILAVTFTDKATMEMGERINELITEQAGDVTVSTFHGLGQRILEMHGLEIGLPNNFKILDEIGSWLLVRENFSQFNLDYFRPLGNPTKFIHALLKHFARCKDELIFPEDYLSLAENIKLDRDTADISTTSAENQLDSKRLAELADAYHIYNKILLENDALDFADLIAYTVKLLRARPNILQYLQKRWKYILVDEFQDTNWAQYELIKLLTRGRENNIGLTMVGDDDQSIYKFRGASVSNILQFNEDFPSCKQIILTENYRSGQKILDYAYNFIQLNNPDRLEIKLNLNKKLHAHAVDAGQIDFLYANTGENEAQLIIEKIIQLKKDNGADWEDCAILTRSNNTIEQLIPFLLHANIPFATTVVNGLFKQKVVLDCLAALRLVDNYHESASVYRLLSCPIYNMSFEDISLLTHAAQRQSISLYETLKTVNTGELILSSEGYKRVMRFLNDVAKISLLSAREPVTAVLYKFLEQSGYLRFLTVNLADNQQQIQYLQTFFETLEAFQGENKDHSVRSWLVYYNYLIEAGETGADKDGVAQGNGVRLLTIHAAKGLEFSYVFIPHLADQRFPTINRQDALELPIALIHEKNIPTGDAHLEEERRLFYVALTRAKKGVFLFSAKDYGGLREKKISRFVEELENTNDLHWPHVVTTPAPSFLSTTKNNSSVNQITSVNTKTLSEYFSFSQIAAYQRCPWQYRYQFLLKVPTLGKGVFSFGKTLHLTLQKFYQQMLEENRVKQMTLFPATPTPDITNTTTKMKVPALEFLLELYKHNWQDDWFYSQENKILYYQKGERILRDFYLYQNKHGWVLPLNLEASFCFKINDFYFKGQIDRIDELPNGEVKLIDYKTGNPKNKLSFTDKLQLLIYQWAANHLRAGWPWGRVSQLAYYYLDNNTEINFLGQEKDLARVEQEVVDAVAAIRRSDFIPRPDVNNCAHCDFKEICDFRI